jgi:hypothetical protein
MIYSKNFWGPKVWYLLHAFSINGNYKINVSKKHNYYIFYTSFIYVLPCYICGQHYTEILYNINKLEEDKINRLYMKRWVYNTHSIVNNILDKKKYKYSKLKEDYKILDNNKIFYTLKILLYNLDFNKMSLITFDQVYSFFKNFCIIYPDKIIRKNLKNIIKTNHFLKAETPKQFKKWLDGYFFR